MMSQKECAIIIDLGSSLFRAYLVNSDGTIIAQETLQWMKKIDPMYPNIIEYEIENIEKEIISLIRKLIDRSKIEPKNIIAISCIAQRTGTVFLDFEGKLVYIGPNIDARGALVDFQIEDDDIKDIYNTTGHTPPFIFAPMRYVWFKENDEKKANRIAKILTIHDWIIYLLTGEYATEPSISSSTILMNIHTDKWDHDILSIFNIDPNMLPEIKSTGEIISTVKDDLRDKLKLSSDTVVILGGGDTQFGTLATRSFKSGDYSCVAGYTAPVQAVLDEPIIDEEMRVWTERYVLPRKWVIESNSGMLGGLIEWFVSGFLGTEERPYKKLNEVIQSINPADCNVQFFFGYNIMDAKNMANYKPLGMILFPNPSVPFLKKENIETFIYGFIESLAFGVVANVKQINKITKIKISKLGFTGGVSRLEHFIRIIVSTLDVDSYVTTRHNGSTLGCAALLFYKLGIYSDLNNALEKMIPMRIIHSDKEKSQIYQEKYTDWVYNYEQLRESI